MLVPSLYSKLDETKTSPLGSALKTWSIGLIFYSSLSFPWEGASWAILPNHSKLCWFGRKTIMVAVKWLFLPVLLGLCGFELSWGTVTF